MCACVAAVVPPPLHSRTFLLSLSALAYSPLVMMRGRRKAPGMRRRLPATRYNPCVSTSQAISRKLRGHKREEGWLRPKKASLLLLDTSSRRHPSCSLAFPGGTLPLALCPLRFLFLPPFCLPPCVLLLIVVQKELFFFSELAHHAHGIFFSYC